MWKKNLLFVAILIIGLGSIVRGLLTRERLHGVRGYHPARFSASSQTNSPHDDWVLARNHLNAAFQSQWKVEGITAASRASDLAIARRISLALMGTVPSLEEIRAFEKIAPEHRLEWWISYVLADPRFGDYVAERLARAYVGTEDGPFILYRRNRFVSWLASQLQKNLPYDQTVRHILRDEGLWTDTPAVNFVSVALDPPSMKEPKPDPVKLATRTTRAFLAQRLDCLQCHDDNLNTLNFGTEENPVPGEQKHFHQLAAFFGEASWTRRGISDLPSGKYQMKYLNAEDETLVSARVPFGQDYFSAEPNRLREQLARWVTHPENKPFARAMVNRMWAILFGKPMNDTVDHIPLQGPFPPGMELLADDFIAHDFNVQRMIRLIVASDVFQQESAADFEITPKHEQNWAVFPISSLRPEQMAGTLIQASKLGTIDGDAHLVWKLVKFGQTNDFVRRYGDAGQDEFVERGGTIPQRLMMMNGNLVNERTKQNIVLNASTRIAILTPNSDQAIETAFLATLTRRPSDLERRHFAKRFQEPRPNRIQKLEDLYWTLINSTEFSWNH